MVDGRGRMIDGGYAFNLNTCPLKHLKMSDKDINELLKKIPQIDRLLLQPEMAALREKYPRIITQFAREAAEELRSIILQGRTVNSPEIWLHKAIKAKLEYCLSPKLKSVINATGVILHTGLGRAPFSQDAQDNIAAISQGYSNLEIDLPTGRRGQRLNIADSLICQLTGAEMSAVVNNNAAAVLLALNSLAYRKEVIVSRGELVEIGGSFRLPEVIRKSGAKMVEIGTTNKTKPQDYAGAISPKTGAILKVHTSNYKVMGFTQEISISELAEICGDRQIPLISDLGGGVLVDLRIWGLPYEPVAEEHILAGADIVTFSGDKVLGGPQSGIICGKKWAVEKCRKNHLMRALRCDKLILAALEATLKAYLSPDNLAENNPAIGMLTASVEKNKLRAENFALTLKEKNHPNLLSAEALPSFSQAGSGALPLEKIPSYAVHLKPEGSVENFVRVLRTGEYPVIPIIQDDKVILDFRTIFPDEEESLLKALVTALNSVRIKRK